MTQVEYMSQSFNLQSATREQFIRLVEHLQERCRVYERSCQTYERDLRTQKLQLTWFQELLANKTMNQSAKGVAMYLKCLDVKCHPRGDGFTYLSIKKMSETIRLGRKQCSSYIHSFEFSGFLQLKVEQGYNEDEGHPSILIFVKIHSRFHLSPHSLELLDENGEVRQEKRGGKRVKGVKTCPRCGDVPVQVRKATVCTGCGETLSLKEKIVEPEAIQEVFDYDEEGEKL